MDMFTETLDVYMMMSQLPSESCVFTVTPMLIFLNLTFDMCPPLK